MDYAYSRQIEHHRITLTEESKDLLADAYKNTNHQSEKLKEVSKTLPAIGEAWLEKDGAITLHLRRDAAGRSMNATFTYKKTDKDYSNVLKHLNGLKPGEKKLVRPWSESR